MVTFLLFVAILSLLVIVHEGGHFMAARWAKMKVYEFAIGFPPRLFAFYKDPATKRLVFVFGKGKEGLAETISGEEPKEEYPNTLYSINLLPLGGFVRIKGENGEKSNEPDSFGAQKAWKRVVVLVAGVAMNFLLAAILLGAGFVIGLPVDSSSFSDSRAIFVEAPHVVIQEVAEDSPADRAGMKFGDEVVSVGTLNDLASQEVREYIGGHPNESISFVLRRGGIEETVSVTPEKLEDSGEEPRIGVVLGDVAVVRYPWYLAIPKGFLAAGIGVVNILVAFAFLFWNLVTGHGLAFDVSGPVGIAVIIGESARLGFHYIVNVTAMISLSLAVLNILPIPALDGGRVFFVLLGKILKKPVSMKYEQMAHTVGFVLLLGLIVLVTWRDVMNFF